MRSSHLEPRSYMLLIHLKSEVIRLSPTRLRHITDSHPLLKNDYMAWKLFILDLSRQRIA